MFVLGLTVGIFFTVCVWAWADRPSGFRLPWSSHTPITPPPIRIFKGRVNRYAIKRAVRVHEINGYYASKENRLIHLTLDDAVRELARELAKNDVFRVRVDPPEVIPGTHVYYVEISVLAAPPDPEFDEMDDPMSRKLLPDENF